MNRTRIVAGNWKMNKSYEEGRDLAKAIAENLQPSETVVVLAPPFIHLRGVAAIAEGVSNLHVAAQNCHQENSGAYTGEISAPMVRSTGAEYVILGHSERRQYFGEDGPLLADKVKAALAAGLKPIFCCGEPLEIREAGAHVALVVEQLEASVFDLSPEDFAKVVIAYEPVWAIGTGRTASPEQAQDMHKEIRDAIAKKYGRDLAQQTSILYGGSCKASNAPELFSQPDVDGGLIGGASLDTKEFMAIIGSFPA
ncbi:MAG TPA: triose-phosphate isomerase [Flavilitoribacter sp.]|nr:triose-phosphate isomerase [Flavilitoribacter sp.]HMQ87692.1 triose-phosphate isomerase [Flavilitoribacter sp.]